MARRASSSLHPGILIGGVVVIVILIIAGRSMLGKQSSGFGDVQKLEVRELLENGNSLRGSQYVVEGRIDEKLRWTSSRGQVVSLRVEVPGGEEFIGVEIPPDFNDLNIEREQRYAFRIKFRQGGIPVATGINRL